MNFEPENASPIRRLLIYLMGPVSLTRISFVLVIIFLGYMLRPDPHLWMYDPNSKNLLSVGAAFLLALVIILFEYSSNIISSKNILLAAGGLFFGLLMADYFYPIISPLFQGTDTENRTSLAVCTAIFGYFGIILAIKHAERFQLSNLKSLLSNPQGPAYILDTSVIIDGRVIEMLKLNLLQGPLIVPQFVLSELQSIADSEESQRRQKGRRGLSVLEDLRVERADMRVWGHDYPDIDGVDNKLVRMAKEIQGIIVTNDYNLEKVATLQQVGVLNINELSNALRPSVYVGHAFRLELIREGKESHQGVGYLDDGTMVVVDDGNDYVGQEIEVVVSSILQTTGGRMIFARPRRETVKG